MRLIRLLIVLSVQVLILNQIHLFGYITPLFIGYVLICMPKNVSRISMLLWGFATGLLFDIFSNTAGMASASCTFLAMMRPMLLSIFTPRDSEDSFRPAIVTLGIFHYWIYSLLCMLVLHTVFFLLDALSLNDWQLTLFAIGGSSFLASLICICAELIVRKRR